MENQEDGAQLTDQTDLGRREAMKHGLAMVAAGGVAFNAPKVQGLAVLPKHGSALSQIKKRRRCRTGPVQFRCQPRRRTAYRRGDYKSSLLGGLFGGSDPFGICNFKSGIRAHKDDFLRNDISKFSGLGTVSGDSLPFDFIVAENTGSECPVIFQFASSLLRFSRLSFLGANNCRVPNDVFSQVLGFSGACEVPLMWSTPSWAAGTNTLSMSCSFEEAAVGKYSGK